MTLSSARITARCMVFSQFAHVARPVVVHQQAHRALGDLAHGLPSSSLNTLRKWKASAGMSSRRSRSGGDVDREDVDAVEEILAERARGHHRLQVLVGRGDQPDVGGLGAGVADRA